MADDNPAKNTYMVNEAGFRVVEEVDEEAAEEAAPEPAADPEDAAEATAEEEDG